MPASISISSCAKINLSLDIIGRRADGYHELRSVVHTVALCDTLDFHFDRSGQWRLRCDDASLETPDNLCLRAARLWTEAARQNGFSEPIGGAISLRKRIPYGAGLGGGSGNAWAVLRALSEVCDPDKRLVPQSELEILAKRLGADVPLFARGGAMLIEGIGERITPLAPLAGWVVLAQPRQIISTPAAFRAWDESGSRSGQSTAPLLEAWGQDSDEQRLIGVASWLGNDFWQAACALGVPVAAGVGALLQVEGGALGAAMTGSGSAVFGLCRDEEHAQEVEQRARLILAGRQHEGDEWRMWRAALCSYGTRLDAGTST